jgi:sodium-coupled neutral amino acid transporter 11
MQEDDYQILEDNDYGKTKTTCTTSSSGSPKASLSASIFNLSNTTLGAGIVSIPYFFSQSGVVLGSVLLLFIAILGAGESMLLVKAANVSGCWSYMEMAERAWGDKGQVAVQVTMLSLTIGIMSAFFVQLGETGGETLTSLLPSKYDGGWWTEPTIVKAFFTFTILLPLGMQRSLASLSQASLLVVVFLVYLVIMVIFLGDSVVGDDDDANDDGGDGRGDDDDDDDGKVKAAFLGSEFFTALPIVVLAFGNQLNIPTVVSEMEAPTNARVRHVIFGTQAIVSILYLIIGLCGYSHFIGATEDNIMSNYHGLHGSTLALFSVARVGVVFVVLFSYPMLLFPGRASLHSVIEPYFKDSDSESGSITQFLWKHSFEVETIFLIALTFLISIVVPVLGVIMGYTGIWVC